MKSITRIFFSFTILAVVLLFPQCASSDYDDEGDGIPTGSPYDMLNPERGWYISRGTDEATLSELSSFKNADVSIVLFEANLGEYITRPLDNPKLTEIKNAFSLARQVGLSVIFRAAYDFDGKSNPEPKSIDIILNHINQLKTVFVENEDILFNVQAGFLGAWGEWHHSYYGNPKDPDGPPYPQHQRTVVNELLKVVPKSVTIALRRPEYIRNIADDTVQATQRGNHLPVAEGEAFDGESAIARLAFHNDALMSDSTDMDTYIAPGYDRPTELNWINKQTRYTPMVAETNLVSSYNDANKAIPFLDQINIQSLNLEYHQGVIRKWHRTNYDDMSAFDYISMRIGYRFVLNQADISQKTDGNLRLDLEIVNSGFGHLLREKKFELVLIKGGKEYRAKINEDARFWDKNKPINRTYNFKLPSNIALGDWDAYLGLSSTFEELADNSAYSVRLINGGFTNAELWDAGLGLNKIGAVNLTIVPDTGNGQDFTQIQ